MQLELAALAALGFVLAVALARRLVPEPWATAGPLVCALSPPALAYSTAVEPPLVAGTVLAGAAVLALRGASASELLPALGCGLLLALLPWLGTQYLVAAIPIAVALAWWMGRRTAAGSRSWRLEVAARLARGVRDRQRAPVRGADPRRRRARR